MESFTFFLDVLTRGIGMGMAYALMGLGLTLIFGVMRIVNFAQGEFYMLGSYVIFTLITMARLPFFIAIPLGMAVMFLVGVLVEKLLLSPIAKGKVDNPMEYSLIITFALTILFQKIAVIVFGPYFQTINSYLPGNYKLGPVTLSGNLVVVMIFSVFMIGLTSAYLKYTWRGRGWRAISMSPPGASILGVSLRKESSMVFGLSSALAAGAGAILAPITLIFPTVGVSPLIKGYEILAIGGLGSVPGSLVGGILLGVGETLGSVYLNSAYRDFYGFGLLVLFLVFRPKGLFGQDS